MDLCCGPGSHSNLLALHNDDVTGIDNNATALVQARKKLSWSDAQQKTPAD